MCFFAVTVRAHRASTMTKWLPFVYPLSRPMCLLDWWPRWGVSPRWSATDRHCPRVPGLRSHVNLSPTTLYYRVFVWDHDLVQMHQSYMPFFSQALHNEWMNEWMYFINTAESRSRSRTNLLFLFKLTFTSEINVLDQFENYISQHKLCSVYTNRKSGNRTAWSKLNNEIGLLPTTTHHNF